ncbi:MAG: molybdopterin synthase sulfur carrier subunit [Chloroflexi bacterium]|nr:molybdopterin synthase sulfur carrier subunit [Chloroflexota bacterium]|tara:strand:+ start:6513 stop:6788 length:276 start_codon:yes stop_codon:yes gene_type:complete
MTINVYIPTPFVKFTDGQSNIVVEKTNVFDALHEVVNNYQQMGQLIFDTEGNLPEHINVYVNNQAIDSLNGLKTNLEDGDQVAIIPALSGG